MSKLLLGQHYFVFQLSVLSNVGILHLAAVSEKIFGVQFRAIAYFGFFDNDANNFLSAQNRKPQHTIVKFG